MLKLLFDQGTLAPLRIDLSARSVETLVEKSWSELENGEFHDRVEEGQEVLVTTDQTFATGRF